jgi:hypothetical protein
MLKGTSAFILVVLLLPACAAAQADEDLIINPRLKGGIGSVTFFHKSKIVRRDTMPPGWWDNRERRTHGVKDYVPPDAPPTALLITGMVPDPSRRWVVAVTRDEEEFRSAFPEYRRLVAEGRRREAAQVLHIARGMAVSTKVTGFWGNEKTRDLPEKVGSFFFEFDMMAFRKHGGCLTFLSYEPKRGNDTVDFGYGIGETVHGVLMIEEQPAADGGKPEYTMRIVKARVME